MLGYTGQWKTWGSPELHTNTHITINSPIHWKINISHHLTIPMKCCFYYALFMTILNTGTCQFTRICGNRLDTGLREYIFSLR